MQTMNCPSVVILAILEHYFNQTQGHTVNQQLQKIPLDLTHSHL